MRKISKALEISTGKLKILRMYNYKGVSPPKWVVGKSVTHPERMDNENTILSNSDDNEMTVLFPLLEQLEIWRMMNLRELVSHDCWSTGVFPNLCKLNIYYCPKLGRLPPHLKALKYVTVRGGCSDELLDSIWNLNGTLTHIELSGLNKDVEHIVTVNNMNITSGDEMNGIEVVPFPLLEELKLVEMKNLRGLVSPTIPSPGAFPKLGKLVIDCCTKLVALPPHLKSLKHVTIKRECTDELLYSISNLSALTHLSLRWINERSVLFGAGKALMFDDDDEIPSSSSSSQILGELGVRSTFKFLQSLSIWNCNKLRSLFDEEMMQGLTELNIRDCPELMISSEEFGKKNINNSLQRLTIWNCPKLVSSEEADDVISLLRSIRTRIGPNNFRVDESITRKIGKIKMAGRKWESVDDIIYRHSL